MVTELIRSFAERGQTSNCLPMRFPSEWVQFERLSGIFKSAIKSTLIKFQMSYPRKRADNRVENFTAPGTNPILEVSRKGCLSHDCKGLLRSNGRAASF